MNHYQSHSHQFVPQQDSSNLLNLDEQKNQTLYRETQFQNIIHEFCLKLESRIQNLEVKVHSLSNIIKLLQDYTQKKDIQYQKERQTAKYWHDKISLIQNYHNMMNGKITQIDEFQSKILTKMQFLQGNRKDFESQKLDKIKIDSKSKLFELQQKINYEIQQLKSKTNKIEANMLKQIRNQNQRQYIENNYDMVAQLNFRFSQLENQIRNNKATINRRIDLVGDHIKDIENRQKNQYGLFEQQTKKNKSKGKDKQSAKSKRKNKEEKQSSPFKRLKKQK